MSTNVHFDPARWVELASSGEEEQVAESLRLILDEAADQRQATIASALEAESALSDAEMQSLAAMRLRALAHLAPEQAQELHAEWDAAERRMTGNAAMRRVFMLQAACKGLTLDDVSRIEPFYPAVRQMAGLPPVKVQTDPEIALPEASATKKGLFSRLLGRA